MGNLEYKIGGLNINPEKMHYEGQNSYDATHLFVVEAIKEKVSIYVAPAMSHYNVALHFKLDFNKMVGGGSFYTNSDKELVLDNYSTSYYAIPQDAAQKFAELTKPELEKQGVRISGINVNPLSRLMSRFWQD